MVSQSDRNQHQYDLRLDIPARSIINADIIQSAESSGTLDSHKTGVIQKLNLSIEPTKYHTLDQAYIASLLYCLFVVPRDVLDLPVSDDLFTHLDTLVPLQYFEVIQLPDGFREATSYWLLKKLRDSVAHALYEIDWENNWSFWTDRKPKWEARASKNDLMRFVSIFGREFANCCLARKSM